MAKKTTKPAGKVKAAKIATKKPAPKPTKKPAEPAPKETPKPASEGSKKVKATISLREGEYGKSARVEFPHPYYVRKILEVTDPKEQKKYRFRYFDNILVAGLHSKDLSKFLQDGAKKAGFELLIKE